MDEAIRFAARAKTQSRPRPIPRFATCSNKLPTSCANGPRSGRLRSYIATSPVSYIRPKMLCQ